MIRSFTLYALMLCSAISVSAQDIVTDLSERQVDIRYSFNGANLLLFGTVDLPQKLRGKRYDVAVVVKGPPEDINVRQKEKTAIIWINRDVHIYRNVPGFYMVASNKPLLDITSLNMLNSEGVGYQSLAFDDKKHTEHADIFHDALVRGKENLGLYLHDPSGVAIVGGGLFRADIRLPANVPVGAFKVSTFIYVDGKLITKREMPLDVEKKGFEREVYSFAHDYPLYYGLTAVLIALTAGWVAGFAARK
jgi:uncharacterized protein (TIGR02186 family)